MILALAVTVALNPNTTNQPNANILDKSKFKALADDKTSATPILKSGSGRIENIVGEEKTASYQHLLLIFHYVLRRPLFQGRGNLGLCGKGLRKERNILKQPTIFDTTLNVFLTSLPNQKNVDFPELNLVSLTDGKPDATKMRESVHRRAEIPQGNQKKLVYDHSSFSHNIFHFI